jgi:hypothetical protein
LKGEAQISKEHVDNNLAVRKMLKERDVLPEKLPALDDIKKVQRKLISDERKILKKDYENADKNISKFKDFLSESKFNPALANDLTSCLQLLNNKNNFTDFELEDIS